MKIEIENGTYTYKEAYGQQFVFRYGELWRDLTGDKFVHCLATELAAKREKVKELELQAIANGHTRRNLAEQLAAAQVTIEQMRGTLDHINRHTPLDYKTIKFVEHALAIPANLDALHEARAQECERLAAQYYLRECKDWLLEEAATHRAKKGK